MTAQAPLVDIQLEAALLPDSMKLWEQIRDLQAGLTPSFTVLPGAAAAAGTEPEPEPQLPPAEYLRRHGLSTITEQALGQLGSTSNPYAALAAYFQQRADAGTAEPAAPTVTAAAVRAAFSKGYFNRCLSMAEKVVSASSPPFLRSILHNLIVPGMLLRCVCR